MRRTIKEIQKEIDKVNLMLGRPEKYRIVLLFKYRDGLQFALGEKKSIEK